MKLPFTTNASILCRVSTVLIVLLAFELITIEAEEKKEVEDEYIAPDNLVTVAAAPPNDLCNDAIPLGINTVVPGTTVGATVDSSFPFCGTSVTSPGVWYKVVGTGTTMTASTCNDGNSNTGSATYDTKISVFCGSCSIPICVAGLDDTVGECTDFSTKLSWPSAANVEYLILVHGFGGATGDFNLAILDDGIPTTAPQICPSAPACEGTKAPSATKAPSGPKAPAGTKTPSATKAPSCPKSTKSPSFTKAPSN